MSLALPAPLDANETRQVRALAGRARGTRRHTKARASGAPAAPAADAGKKLYDTSCAACHAAGVAGAPKFGDKAAWAPRIKTGEASLVASVIKGKGAMPPKGAAASATDAEIAAMADYFSRQPR